MNSWIIFSLMTVVLWGLWGLFLKISSDILNNWMLTYIFSYIFPIILAISLIITIKPDNIPLNIGSVVAVIGGFFGTVGYILFLKALQSGPAALIVPLTSLYPAITVILSYVILREQITIPQMIGIILAIIAVFLITMQK